MTDTEIIIGTATDLSGVTAVQGVNSADAIRLAFDELNAAGGVNGRKIHYIVEDTQYQVPRAVQAINKLINNDGVFFTIEDGGTPMNSQCQRIPDGDREERAGEVAAAIGRSFPCMSRYTG